MKAALQAALGTFVLILLELLLAPTVVSQVAILAANGNLSAVDSNNVKNVQTFYIIGIMLTALGGAAATIYLFFKGK